jgi:DNA-binding PadR family transcriptional regulator
MHHHDMSGGYGPCGFGGPGGPGGFGPGSGYHGPRGLGRHGRHMRGGFFGRGGIVVVILDLLKEQPRHGYDLIREMEDRSGGIYSPSPGVIYPTLQSLEDRDFVTATETGGKKVYSITEAGTAWLDQHQEQVDRYRERMNATGGRPGAGEWHGLFHEVKWLLEDIVKATRDTAGDPDKVREIKEIVKEAKSRVDEILAR